MKPLRIQITPEGMYIHYDHDYQEKTNGDLYAKDVEERDRVAAALLRKWADVLEAGSYDHIGHASDARRMRRDQLSVKEGA